MSGKVVRKLIQQLKSIFVPANLSLRIFLLTIKVHLEVFFFPLMTRTVNNSFTL